MAYFDNRDSPMFETIKMERYFKDDWSMIYTRSAFSSTMASSIVAANCMGLDLRNFTTELIKLIKSVEEKRQQ